MAPDILFFVVETMNLLMFEETHKEQLLLTDYFVCVIIVSFFDASLKTFSREKQKSYLCESFLFASWNAYFYVAMVTGHGYSLH